MDQEYLIQKGQNHIAHNVEAHAFMESRNHKSRSEKMHDFSQETGERLKEVIIIRGDRETSGVNTKPFRGNT
ncbi:hypothetical protein [Bartonella quintana]|uniref:hypothetical protein n=1 Tax=Bartonella quintana TaxID=803 RepID=UPI0005B49758|nr:hypothetical protein [Bartonella quintana]